MRHKHKFGAKQAIHDGIKFPSMLEGRYYEHLKLLIRANEVLFFLRQIPFYLPGGVTYRVDFQVFYTDGSVSFIDVKGLETQAFIDKKKMVESLYPVEIEVVKKGQF